MKTSSVRRSVDDNGPLPITENINVLGHWETRYGTKVIDHSLVSRAQLKETPIAGS